jgi:hypothetical protein
MRNPKRRLFYAASLSTYLTVPAGVLAPCFTDHAGLVHALVPLQRNTPPRQVQSSLVQLTPALW